jgi:Ca-activated chloride channel homolog
MRPNQIAIAKGVRTMKSFVAFLLVLTTVGSGAVKYGQSVPQKQKLQSAGNKPRNETLRICQGVPIPEGYVIIAYLTSTSCPHGAYVLKKQDGYESSLSVNGGSSSDPSSAAAKTTPGRRTNSTAKGNIGSTSPPQTSGTNARNSNGTLTAPDQSGSGTSSSTGSSVRIIRPRRVDPNTVVINPSQSANQPPALAQTDDDTQTPDEPPVLIGSQRGSRPGGPPTLGGALNSSATSAGDPSSTDPSASAGPEEVGEGDVLRVNTSFVTVPVSVMDRQGRFISNMKKEDFQVFENDVEQSISFFESAEKPFTVALLLDTSASTHFHLSEIKEAAIAFAKQLRPQDRVLIVSFNDQVMLLTEVTNDMNVIETVIEENATTGNSTRLYDAVDLTIRERLNKIQGRKAIVLFSDGVDTSSQKATYQSTLREVEELDALIYPIQYDTSDYVNAMQNGSGNGTVTVTTTRRGIFGTSTSQQTYTVPGSGQPIPGSTKEDYERADQYLHALADKTGGRLYEANDTRQLAKAFSSIAEELRRQYSIGYYPKTNDGDSGNGRRQIRVRVRQPNLAVKARGSYMRTPDPVPMK